MPKRLSASSDPEVQRERKRARDRCYRGENREKLRAKDRERYWKDHRKTLAATREKSRRRRRAVMGVEIREPKTILEHQASLQFGLDKRGCSKALEYEQIATFQAHDDWLEWVDKEMQLERL